MLKYSEFDFRAFEGMGLVALSFWCCLFVVPLTFVLTMLVFTKQNNFASV